MVNEHKKARKDWQKRNGAYGAIPYGDNVQEGVLRK